jgi:protein pelota
LILSSFDPKHGLCSLIVESADDLWTLRRLIEVGDTVVTRSSRVVKNEDEYSRPDKGERVRITISLIVDSVSLDRSVARLRVRGRIKEATDESISKAGSHSISISPDHGLTLQKENWTPLHTEILRLARSVARRFLMVAIDRSEAGIGLLSGSHLSIITTVESGASGKRGKEVSIEPFLRKVAGVVKAEWKEGDTIAVAGPGHTKLELANLISSDKELVKNLSLIEGFDLAGTDGIRSLIKSEGFQKVASESVLVEVQGIVTEAVRRISRGDPRVVYTLPRVNEAVVLGAVESCVASDDVFSHGVEEEDVVSVFNTLEAKGGKVYLVDSSLELGKQISSFGGILALLRYAIKPY